jgi:hypothetical protein
MNEQATATLVTKEAIARAVDAETEATRSRLEAAGAIKRAEQSERAKQILRSKLQRRMTATEFLKLGQKERGDKKGAPTKTWESLSNRGKKARLHRMDMRCNTSLDEVARSVGVPASYALQVRKDNEGRMLFTRRGAEHPLDCVELLTDRILNKTDLQMFERRKAELAEDTDISATKEEELRDYVSRMDAHYVSQAAAASFTSYSASTFSAAIKARNREVLSELILRRDYYNCGVWFDIKSIICAIIKHFNLQDSHRLMLCLGIDGRYCVYTMLLL